MRLQALVRGFLTRRKRKREEQGGGFVATLAVRLCTVADTSLSSLSLLQSGIELYDPFSIDLKFVFSKPPIVVTEELLDKQIDTAEDLREEDDRQYRLYDDLNRSRSKGPVKKSSNRELSPYDNSWKANLLQEFYSAKAAKRKSNRLYIDPPLGSNQHLRHRLKRSHSLSVANKEATDTLADLRRKKTKSRMVDSLTPHRKMSGQRRFSSKASGLKRRLKKDIDLC